jgi:hypothetical protein
VLLRPEFELEGISVADVLQRVLQVVTVPR